MESIEKNSPWISDHTLELILKRREANQKHNFDEKRTLNKLIKHSIQQDKSAWLHDMLEDRIWQAVQKFRKSNRGQVIKLRSSSGHLLPTHERAEGLAEYLEKIQWAVRPDTIPSEKSNIFNFHHLDCNDYTSDELKEVLTKLKKGKKCGDDGILPDFWRLCLDSNVLFTWLLDFINLVWHRREIPRK